MTNEQSAASDHVHRRRGRCHFKSLFAGLLNRLGQVLHLPTKVLQLRLNVVRSFADLWAGFIHSLREPLNSLRDLIDVFREDDKTGKGRATKQVRLLCMAVGRLLADLRGDLVDLLQNDVDVHRKCGETPKGLASQQVCSCGDAGGIVVAPLSRLNERLNFALCAHGGSLQLGESAHFVSSPRWGNPRPVSAHR